MKNSIGNIFRVTTFGESHGVAIGGVIDGMPAGIEINLEKVQNELDRRRPGQSAIVTARDEKDRVKILSGMFEGKTTGTSIGFIVENGDQHSTDYENIRTTFRPSHADYTYTQKYGLRDHRGGGRSSARETIARVVAGAFARQALEQLGVKIYAYTSQVGNICLDSDYTKYDLSKIESNEVRCPDATVAKQMYDLISQVKSDGDTIGGVITGVVKGVPVGLGEPAFGKLHAQLGAAMLGINAVKGFEYGMGFAGVGKRGSEMIDRFYTDDAGNIKTTTNNSGGIQGGISNGEDIYFRVAFKPVATLLQEVETIDADGNATILKAKGRHDPCVLPRAVPIVEAMAAIVILDAYLKNKTTHL
ncbi:MAG: chorismate synthase [Muribaculaceae bacterium]|nr:chorismate synthase [Muribaculaceae bacterium]MBR6640003.1 chorismate synthase [Muribaculaceae bacterium]